MGIRFQCPNGHQLNIKTFLAGKRGICPHCSARFVIPKESGVTVEALPKKNRNRSHLATVVAAAATTPAAAAPTAAQPADAIQPSTTVDSSVSPLSAPTAPEGVPAVDPLLESPEASWYVRPRTGGQFGPALPDVMRRWISEGRVSRDSLVWRDGWSDWKGAVETFPELADSADADGNSSGSPEPISTATARAHVRRSSNQFTLAMVVIMIFLTVVLLVGLIFVVSSL